MELKLNRFILASFFIHLFSFFLTVSYYKTKSISVSFDKKDYKKDVPIQVDLVDIRAEEENYASPIGLRKTISITGNFDFKADKTYALKMEEKKEIAAPFISAAMPVVEHVDNSNMIFMDDEEDEGEEPIPLDTTDERYADYFYTIRKKLEEVWKYPEEAALGGIFGVAKVNFIIDRAGGLVITKIVDSSGHNILDEEAVSSVKNAAPYYPMPDKITEESLSIVATFRYRPSYSMVER